MPFTFSHPAIVLPLAKARLKFSATGLIIGSVIPDFEYFIRMRNVSLYSHTLTGIFWFDVPLALLVCFLYHLMVRNSLFNNLPSFLKDRFSSYKYFNWPGYFVRNWAVVIVSIIIGATSHILWDGVTHHTIFYINQADLSTMMTIGKIKLAGYKFLQLASTIAGGLAVIYSIFALRRIDQPKTKIDYRYWTIVWFITFLVVFLRFAKNGFQLYYENPDRVIIVTFISSLMIGLIVTPMLLNQKQLPATKISMKKKEEVDTL